MNSPDQNYLSVIIPTYNRAYILGECFEALASQTAPQERFEIIVVDNNSTDNTLEIVESFTSKLSNLRVICEPCQGLGYARNAGLNAAKGSWIAYLDSDAKPVSQWVEVVLREMEKNAFDCIGGPATAWHFFGPAPRWFCDQWESTEHIFDKYEKLGRDYLPNGNNCAFKADLAKTLKGFPTDMGMKGEDCAYGEETELFLQMYNRGARVGSVPQMRIEHCILPYKYGLTWRMLAAYEHGKASGIIANRNGHTGKGMSWLAQILKAAVKAPAIFMRDCLRHPWQRALINATSPFLRAVGFCYSVKR